LPDAQAIDSSGYRESVFSQTFLVNSDRVFGNKGLDAVVQAMLIV